MNFVRPKKISKNMTSEIFRQFMILMVINRSVSLSLFNSFSFAPLISQLSDALGIKLDSTSIRKKVISQYRKARKASLNRYEKKEFL